MKKFKKIFKCFFGKHEWKEYSDSTELTRTCIHCKKTQFCYMGEWI